MTSRLADTKIFGVVAVAVSDDRFLVIRRSLHVAAPGAFCFPGGRVEAGESEEAALAREMTEELAVEAAPIRRVWRSVTSWHVELAWWLVRLDSAEKMRPYDREVASVHWLTGPQMRWLPGLLESNSQFLDALDRGEIVLTH